MIAKKSPWRRIAITVAAMAVVLLLVASFRFVQARGIFASVENKTPASCHGVEGISRIADIASDEIGNVYLAASDGLYVYGGGALTRFSGTPKDFHPAALAQADQNLLVLFQQDGTWKISAFRVKLAEIVSDWNRGIRSAETTKTEKSPVVERVFVTKPIPPKVEEVGRMSADQLTDPADLVSIDGTRFYLVNRHKSHTALGRWLDDTFLLPRAEVLYFDSMKFVAVAGRLNSPGGLALSPDGSHLYVVQELPRSLASFTRSDFTGALDNAALLSLPAAPRKITMAPDGSLIVAAWPKAGQGAVYRVRVDSGVPQSADLLYATKSEEITAAAEANGHLLIGTQKALIDCRL